MYRAARAMKTKGGGGKGRLKFALQGKMCIKSAAHGPTQ